MTLDNGGTKYSPGFYDKKRPSAIHMVDKYFSEWEKSQFKKKEASKTKLPAICFSRETGVGALEIADILAKKTGYRVIEREFLEHMADNANLKEKTISFFDERYPGKMSELASFFFGEKSFVMKDYTKQLFSAVFSIAEFDPTIFVGRGVHLILPRDRTLAVRFISSKKHRVARLARIMQIKEVKAEKELSRIDSEQQNFYKKVFNKKDVSSADFDMVINCDYIQNPETAAEVVAKALKGKFAGKI